MKPQKELILEWHKKWGGKGLMLIVVMIMGTALVSGQDGVYYMPSEEKSGSVSSDEDTTKREGRKDSTKKQVTNTTSKKVVYKNVYPTTYRNFYCYFPFYRSYYSNVYRYSPYWYDYYDYSPYYYGGHHSAYWSPSPWRYRNSTFINYHYPAGGLTTHFLRSYQRKDPLDRSRSNVFFGPHRRLGDNVSHEDGRIGASGSRQKAMKSQPRSGSDNTTASENKNKGVERKANPRKSYQSGKEEKQEVRIRVNMPRNRKAPSSGEQQKRAGDAKKQRNIPLDELGDDDRNPRQYDHGKDASNIRTNNSHNSRERNDSHYEHRSTDYSIDRPSRGDFKNSQRSTIRNNNNSFGNSGSNNPRNNSSSSSDNSFSNHPR